MIGQAAGQHVDSAPKLTCDDGTELSRKERGTKTDLERGLKYCGPSRGNRVDFEPGTEYRNYYHLSGCGCDQNRSRLRCSKFKK